MTSIDADGNTTYYTYDGDGNILNQQTYDKFDNLISSDSTTYDANGNPLTVTDGDGNTTVYTYDPNGNVTSTKEYDASDTMVNSSSTPTTPTTMS